jgi:hypothetical protein
MPNDSDPAAPTTIPLFVAIGVGLMVVLLAAWATARYSTDETMSWVITGAAGLLAAAVTYALLKRDKTSVVRRPGEH